MPALSFSVSLRNSRATQILNALDAASGNGYFQFFTATRPSTGAALTSQVLLGTCTLSKPCGSVSSGTLTFSAIADDDYADNSGEATWVRGFDGNGNFVLDMNVTDQAGAGPVKMTSTSVISGGRLSFTSCVIAEGNA
jgi:hypothetical protein